MLILSRRNGEKIILNDDIVITIIESKNDNCKLAIDAPRDVKIYREEVYNQIKNINKESDKVSVDLLGDLSGLLPTQKPQKKVVIKKKSDNNEL